MRFTIRGMSWVSRGALLRLGCCLPSGELTLEVCWENPVPCDNQSDSCLVFFWAFGVSAGQSLCVIRNQVTVTFPLEPSQASSPQILLLDALTSALSHKMPFGSFASVFDYWVNILVS